MYNKGMRKLTTKQYLKKYFKHFPNRGIEWMPPEEDDNELRCQGIIDGELYKFVSDKHTSREWLETPNGARTLIAERKCPHCGEII